MAHNKKRYKPENTSFHNSNKINPKLLEDVVSCYQTGQRICKFCYYQRHQTHKISFSADRAHCSKCRQHCDTLWLMPASNLCDNFGNLREVPIPGAPKWFFRNPNKPFAICQRKDHKECYKQAASSEIWYAHTIEELVIWTIEREFGCTFKQYMKQYHGVKTSWSSNSTTTQPQKLAADSKISLDLDDFDDYPSPSNKTEPHNGRLYDPEKTTYKFKRVGDIPHDLLHDVKNLYMQKRTCCKRCYYHKGRECSMELDHYRRQICQKCHHYWDPVTVIPASKLCHNFGKFSTLPVARSPARRPYPNLAHEYCGKEDHFRCFQIYPESGFWYAHSMEEMVIWTVEKDYGTFEEYLEHSGTKSVANTATTATPSSKGNVMTQNHKKTQENGYSKTTQEYDDEDEEEMEENDDIYDPSSITFGSISNIPKKLLSSVAKCYHSRLNTCRVCFYDSLDGKKFNSSPTLSSQEENSNMCERGHYWRPIRVIPKCGMCESYGSYIAIPSLPSHMRQLKSPFKSCTNPSHGFCFDRSREVNPWFPHTIEEMVIWTVERELEKDFSTVYRQYILTKKKPPIKPFASPSTSSLDSGSLLKSNSSANFSGEEKDEMRIQQVPQQVASLATKISSVMPKAEITGSARDTDPTRQNLIAARPSEGAVPTTLHSYTPNQAALDSATYLSPSVPHGAVQLQTYYSLPQQQVYQVQQQLQPQIVPKQDTISVPVPVTSSYAQGLQFQEDHSGEGELTMDQMVQEPDYSYQDISMPLGGAALTLQEASAFFPALLGSSATPAPTSANSFLTQQPVSAFYGPRINSYDLRSSSSIPVKPLVSSRQQTTVIQPQPAPGVSSLSHTQLSKDEGSDSDEEEMYECFLCYREFDSAQEIAKHCSKDQHVLILEKDIGAEKIWRHFPPPPDKSTSEFSLCKRRSRCPSRLRCCKAHSPNELQEWTARYKHRAQGVDLATRQSMPQTASLLSTDLESSDYPAIKITTSSPLSLTFTEIGKPVFWSITLKGQGWQTLSSVECNTSSSDSNNFKISSIEGDTFFTIQPKSSHWYAHSIDEGILLGRATVSVKAVPMTYSGCACRLCFKIGFHEFLYINLELSSA